MEGPRVREAFYYTCNLDQLLQERNFIDSSLVVSASKIYQKSPKKCDPDDFDEQIRNSYWYP